MADLADIANEQIEKSREFFIQFFTNEETKPNLTGICVDCDALIDEKRLAIMPYAKRCLGCQNEFELEMKRAKRGY